MGPGGYLELPYRILGPIPAGAYRLVADGYQPSRDAVLHGEVLYRAGGSDAGGAYQLIVSADGTPPSDPNSDVYLDVTVQGPAINAACGDTLLYRVEFVSGTDAFFEVNLSLEIP